MERCGDLRLSLRRCLAEVPGHARLDSTGRRAKKLAGSTGLEPAASGVTGRRSNQLNYDPRTGVPLPVRQNLPECQSGEGWWAVQDSNL